MHLTDSNIAAYPEYIQESIGAGSYDNFPDINEAITQKLPNAPLRLGQVIFDRDGKGYIYMRARAAFAKGEIAVQQANVVGAVQTADATGNNIQVIKTNLASLTLNSEVGNWLFFAAAGLATVWRRIKANSATVSSVAYMTISKKNTIAGQRGFDPDAPAAAIAGATVVHLHRPYNVSLCGANGYAVGVARNTITDGNCSLFATHGVHLVSVLGDTAAITDGGPVCPGASGIGKGPTATMTALEAWSSIGVGKYPTTSATAVLIPVQLNMLGRI